MSGLVDGLELDRCQSAKAVLSSSAVELRKAQRLEQENEILRRATAYFARDVLPLRSSGRQNSL